MILLTVGTQGPLDRLVGGVDDWAAARSRLDVFAQIGPSAYRPRHIDWVESLEPAEFGRRFEAADAIVAHAGMGTIITALELGKPILVMPRRAALAEMRNDHQVATAKRFLELGRVMVAWDETELPAKLDALMERRASGTGPGTGERIGQFASPELLDTLRRFIHGEAPSVGDAAPSTPVPNAYS